ncbi:hypothetical protein BK816_04960 [Boudabousia tangfeifanii]|uniref:DUF1430 domain-containing protein n=1 Tax=Boudabousia tangfeifanii TaxID=1912795 RepID=A0A1D9MKL9_9ACTO|nr:hypothetical protein [Boudabousia tangfeifanii]AOZ72723.1 hypothetical protein BK816_04960 [Boudabousia tangfeifanii]
MKRLVQVVGVFLGIVVFALAFLRAVQLENMLPLGANDVGYINFQHSTLTAQQIDEGLSKVSADAGLEVLQLSGTTGTREVKIISRGANQPAAQVSLAWYRPVKHGTLLPAAAVPNAPHSGIYALKGSSTARASFEKWLNSIGAVNTWERFTVLQTYFLPLAYQGVLMIFGVAALLVLAAIFAWFVALARSRVIRLSAGHFRREIIFSDNRRLLKLLGYPYIFTLAGCLLGFAAYRPSLVLQLIVPVVALSGLVFLLLSSAATVISLLTFPKVIDWVERKPLVGRFSTIAGVFCAAAIILSTALTPLTYRALLVSRENELAAQQAMQLPERYSVSFGGIVDESRDYDPHVSSFAAMAREKEKAGELVLTRQKHVLPSEMPLLSKQGYQSVVTLNSQAFQDLQNVQGGCSFRVASEVSKDSSLVTEILDAILLSPDKVRELKFYTCPIDEPTIAVENQGIYALAHQPLVVVVPGVDALAYEGMIMGYATNGSIIFSNPKAVIQAASQFGLNLTADSTKDTVSVYAEDQHLGYLVNLLSIVALFIMMLLTIYTSASIMTATKIRSFFPLFLAGRAISQLLRWNIAVDMVFVLLGVGAAVALSWIIEIPTPYSLILLVACWLMLGTVTIRHFVLKNALHNQAYRKG